MDVAESEGIPRKASDPVIKQSDLPSFDFILDDSPLCHQSLKYWGKKSKEVFSAVKDIGNGFKLYHSAGLKSKEAGDEMSEAFNKAAKIFEGDPLLSEPLSKFSDALSRIECYREMFLNQTEILGVQPLEKMFKSYQTVKDIKSQLTKQSEIFHISWEKFSQCQHVHTLQEVHTFERLGHQTLNARQKYQLMLANYIQLLRQVQISHRVEVIHRILEHMLAQFSFFNFSYQLLKEMEPYMSQLFEKLQKELELSKEATANDERERLSMEQMVTVKAKADKSLFPHYDGSTGTFHSSMQTLNATTGKLFNKVGGFFTSGMQGTKNKEAKEHSGHKADVKDQDWEVIEQTSEAPEGQGATANSPLPRTEDLNRPASRSVTSSPQVDSKGEGGSHFYLPLKENPIQETRGVEATDSAEGVLVNIGVGKKEKDGSEVLKKSLDDLTPEEKSEVLRWTESSLSTEIGMSKKGYLRIRQRAFPKNKYPLLYFVVDKEHGELLAQGQDQPLPTLFCSLLLSSVRECDTDDAERNFCFQLITTKDEHTFQALTQSEMKEWMSAIQEAIAIALNKSQARIRSFVRSHSENSKPEQRKRSRTVPDAVSRIKQVDGNTLCADCSAPRPAWASTNIGVVICIECSGVHRSLGVHVSKVKSLTLDRWNEDLVFFMEQRGNAKMNSILEGKIGLYPKPTRDSSKQERRQFIVEKYVDRKFAVPSQSDDPDVTDLVVSSESSEGDDSVLMDPSLPVNTTQQSMDSVVCLVEGCEVCRSGGRHPEDISNSEAESRTHPGSSNSAEESRTAEQSRNVENESSC